MIPNVNGRPVRTVTLCADDYGLAPGVGEAIRALIAQGRLQATGCMTGSPHWPAEAALIKPLEGRADIGLHITLTDQRPLGPLPGLCPEGRLPPLGRLLKLALARQLDRAEIACELERQIDAFETAMGRPPDFLDGHHHVHQLPVISEVVLDLWRRRMSGKGWVRSCFEPHRAILRRGVSPLRAHVISELGRSLRRRLERDNVPHSTSFRGVYDFSGKVPFDQLFATFTDHPQGRTLVMVHPGVVDDALRDADPLTSQREVEYRFLASDACAESLARRHITLSRLVPPL